TEPGIVSFCMLLVSPNGKAALVRLEAGRSSVLAAFREVPGMNKGAGAKNAVHISTSGDSIIAYINGRKFASVRAQAPEKGGTIGLWAQSEKASRDSWKFFNLKVTERTN